jgi:hypothetical protein
MMLIAELAQREGLFDYLAAFAVEHARGSPHRLLLLIYAVGILVTVFLSNDATAIVLTPAVYAATRAAGAKPLPYLFACAFIANAASFVLPISNPANLVVFGERMPHLAEWLRQFALPSLAAILATYVVLHLTQRRTLREENIETSVPTPHLSHGGKLAAIGIAAIGAVLVMASALDIQLGLPTLLCGLITTAAVLALSRQSPWPVLKGVSWSVIPLVAGLFVMVEALVRRHERPSQRAAPRRRRAITVADRVGCRPDHVDCRQHHQQPAGRSCCRLGCGPKSSSSTNRRGHADRRRSRTELLGHRIARDHPVARGAAAAKDRGHGLAFPANRCAGDAAGSDRGVSGLDLVSREPLKAPSGSSFRRGGWSGLCCRLSNGPKYFPGPSRRRRRESREPHCRRKHHEKFLVGKLAHNRMPNRSSPAHPGARIERIPGQ